MKTESIRKQILIPLALMVVVLLAGGIPVLIDPERPVGDVTDHVTHTETRLIVMADDYQDDDSRRELQGFASNRDVALIEMTGYDKVGLGEPAEPAVTQLS